MCRVPCVGGGDMALNLEKKCLIKKFWYQPVNVLVPKVAFTNRINTGYEDYRL